MLEKICIKVEVRRGWTGWKRILEPGGTLHLFFEYVEHTEKCSVMLSDNTILNLRKLRKTFNLSHKMPQQSTYKLFISYHCLSSHHYSNVCVVGWRLLCQKHYFYLSISIVLNNKFHIIVQPHISSSSLYHEQEEHFIVIIV